MGKKNVGNINTKIYRRPRKQWDIEDAHQLCQKSRPILSQEKELCSCVGMEVGVHSGTPELLQVRCILGNKASNPKPKELDGKQKGLRLAERKETDGTAEISEGTEQARITETKSWFSEETNEMDLKPLTSN